MVSEHSVEISTFALHCAYEAAIDRTILTIIVTSRSSFSFHMFFSNSVCTHPNGAIVSTLAYCVYPQLHSSVVMYTFILWQAPVALIYFTKVIALLSLHSTKSVLFSLDLAIVMILHILFI